MSAFAMVFQRAPEESDDDFSARVAALIAAQAKELDLGDSEEDVEY